MELIAQPSDDTVICATCGKPIVKEIVGSLTQWIVASHICSCSKPLAIASLADHSGDDNSQAAREPGNDNRISEIGGPQTAIETDDDARVLSPLGKGKWTLACALISFVSLILVYIFSNAKKDFPMESRQEAEKDSPYSAAERGKLPNIEEHYFPNLSRFEFLKLSSGAYVARAKPFTGDEDLKTLRGRNDIAILDLHRTDVKGPGLEYVADLPIEELNLGETSVEDGALNIVAKMKDLKVLQLQGCRVSDDWIKKIADMPLKHINLNNTDVSAGTLRSLAVCRSLETIELWETPNVDSQALEVLGKFPKLTKLFISTDDKPTEFFQTLGSLRIENLVLSGNKMIPAKNLLYLDTKSLLFFRTKFTRAQFATLRSMKKLKRVGFGYCNINDEQMGEICTLPVEVLSISTEPSISANGYRKLKTMNKLKVFQLPSDTRSIQTALNELHRDRPNIRFEIPDRAGR